MPEPFGEVPPEFGLPVYQTSASEDNCAPAKTRRFEAQATMKGKIRRYDARAAHEGELVEPEQEAKPGLMRSDSGGAGER